MGDRMRYIIIEIGSTNTKASLYDNGVITDLGYETIEFKNHYKKEGHISFEDKEALFNYIAKLKDIDEHIYVYGTSIFRNLKDEEQIAWQKEFNDVTNLTFNVVSPDEENEYTVYGAISEITTDDVIAVMIGGGGSTELALVQNKKIIEKINYPFGAMDVSDAYPDLRGDKATTPLDKMLKETKKEMEVPQHKADLLILAGGDYIMFYETLNYPVSKNTFYDDVKAPYMLDTNTMCSLDNNFLYELSLEKIIAENGSDGWWRGARGMRICVQSLCDLLDTKYIIPTRINMLYGIIEKINGKES